MKRPMKVGNQIELTTHHKGIILLKSMNSGDKCNQQIPLQCDRVQIGMLKFNWTLTFNTSETATILLSKVPISCIDDGS